jgi:hypothetical protein
MAALAGQLDSPLPEHRIHRPDPVHTAVCDPSTDSAERALQGRGRRGAGNRRGLGRRGAGSSRGRVPRRAGLRRAGLRRACFRLGTASRRHCDSRHEPRSSQYASHSPPSGCRRFRRRLKHFATNYTRRGPLARARSSPLALHLRAWGWPLVRATPEKHDEEPPRGVEPLHPGSKPGALPVELRRRDLG